MPTGSDLEESPWLPERVMTSVGGHLTTIGFRPALKIVQSAARAESRRASSVAPYCADRRTCRADEPRVAALRRAQPGSMKLISAWWAGFVRVVDGWRRSTIVMLC